MLTYAGETVAAALRRMKAEKDFSADAFDKITSAAGSIYVYIYVCMYIGELTSCLRLCMYVCECVCECVCV